MFGFIGNLIPGWKVFSGLLGLAAFIVVAVFVYDRFFAEPADLAALERDALGSAVAAAATDVGRFAEAHRAHGVALGSLAGDTLNAEVAHRLRAALEDLDGVGLYKEPLSASVSELFGGDGGAAARLSSLTEARAFVSETPGVDFAVFGTVAFPERTASRARVTLHLVFQGAAEAALFEATYEGVAPPPGPTTDGASFWMGAWAVTWRVFAFVALGFLIPIVSGPLTLGVLRLRSNGANAALLGGYALLDALVVWALLSFAPLTLGAVSALLLGAALCSWWNMRVLNVWDERA